MKIGIALCTFNGKRYLGAQLDSIAAQTRKPDLVLACDDASSDGTVEALESWAAQVPFEVRIVRNATNRGYLRNFEQAIALCETDLIALSDQDDYWRADKLERLEGVFLGNARVVGAFSDADIVDGELKPLGYSLFDALRVGTREREEALAGRLLPVLLRRNVVSGATLVFRAALKERVLPIPDNVVHDEWIALIAAAADGLRFVPERLIQYRQHGANQIGVPRWNLFELVRNLRISRRVENRRVLALMKRVQQRLAARYPGIDRKIAHLERRVALPESRPLRLPAIASELLSGGYHTYASGLRAAVRDLVSP